MCKINGKKLGELRVARGLNQKELAEKVGICNSTLSGYEIGLKEPSEETLNKICLVLNISRDEVAIHDVGFNFANGESKTVGVVRKQKGFVRYYTPVEMEKWINDKRKVSKEEELNEVRICVENSFGTSKKKYILINPTMLHIPKWQRDTDYAKCLEIKENYKEESFDPIKVYVKNGKLYIADGAHRTVALIIKGEPKVLVEVLKCTEHEARMIFLGQSAGRKGMSFCDMYRAGVDGNLEEYILLKHFFEEHNIQIKMDYDKLENPIGIITPNATVLRMLKKDRETMGKVVELIKDLEWTGSKKNVYTIRNLNTLKKMYSNFGEEVEERMMENCKGAVYFESKVAPIKSDAELFDMLSADISK